MRISEQCDDGNILDGDGCSHDCKREFCGDGIVNNGEACDRALTPASCNLDCTLSRCGDGKLNTFAVPPEQCDDGNSQSGDGCSSVCRLEHCGNGVVDSGEDCDGLVGLQPCSATCHTERCGNGILDRDPAHGINELCATRTSRSSVPKGPVITPSFACVAHLRAAARYSSSVAACRIERRCDGAL
jgi:cysteine-rich repeat protein